MSQVLDVKKTRVYRFLSNFPKSSPSSHCQTPLNFGWMALIFNIPIFVQRLLAIDTVDLV